MIKIFQYDEESGQLDLNEPEILLVKEFGDLLELKRNICKEDKTGKLKLRAFKEFKYIYLALDWNSPYSEFTEQEKMEEAMGDSNLTEEEFNDPKFRAACRKYIALQEATLSIRLLNAARTTINRFIDYFNEVDPTERDPDTHKPIYKVKDIMAEVANLSDVIESLTVLTKRVKQDTYVQSGIRGEAEEGFEYSE